MTHLESHKNLDPSLENYQNTEINAENYENDLQEAPQNPQNIWIIKPGEFSNRGNGITLHTSLAEIHRKLLTPRLLKSGQKGTYILQKYLLDPFLYKKRKFDIRCFMLLTSVNGRMKGYWY